MRGAENAQRGHMIEEPQTQIDQATVNLGWRTQRHLAALRASHRGGENMRDSGSRWRGEEYPMSGQIGRVCDALPRESIRRH